MNTRKSALRAVALFEAFKGALVLAAGCGLLALFHGDAQGFAALFERFAHFSAANRIRAVVVLHVTKASPLVSPAYDTGGIEHEIRRNWRDYFESIQPKG